MTKKIIKIKKIKKIGIDINNLNRMELAQKKEDLINAIDQHIALTNIKKNKRAEELLITQKQFNKAMDYHLIHMNFKPMDGRTYHGKPIKKFSRVINFIAVTLGYLTLATFIAYIIVLWII